MTQTHDQSAPPAAQTSIQRPGSRAALWVAAAGLLACLLWSYWPTLVELFEFWQRNQDYSVGQLVPLVAAWLVYRSRRELAADWAGPVWWGLAWIAAGELLRLGGVYYGFGSIERYALLLTLPGIVLTLGGWRVLYRLRWVLVFLFLMVPLPGRLHEAIAVPLQARATSIAVFGLETLGFFVAREGNVLRMEESTTISVTEACSGLRMLAAFVFVAAVLAFLIKRPRWQKALLLASSIPIAVLSNGIRGIATAVFVYYAKNPSLSEKFHDGAGLAMMPLALAILALELKLLSLFSRPVASPGASSSAAPNANRRNTRSAGNGRPGDHAARAMAGLGRSRPRARTS